jgi:hypothetical protein
MRGAIPADVARAARRRLTLDEIERVCASTPRLDAVERAVYTDPVTGTYSLSSYGLWLPPSSLADRVRYRRARGVVGWADYATEALARSIDASVRDVERIELQRPTEARSHVLSLGAVALAWAAALDDGGGY